MRFVSFCVVVAMRITLGTAAPIVVTLLADAGYGSLRWAIAASNSQPGLDQVFWGPTCCHHSAEGAQITFLVPPPVSGSLEWRIKVLSPLPAITDAVVVDHDPSTQPAVVLHGGGGDFPGLLLTAHANSTLRGLTVEHFGGVGVKCEGDGHTLVSMRVTDNGGHGVLATGAAFTLSASVLLRNGFDGLSATGAYAVVQSSYFGVDNVPTGNALDGNALDGNALNGMSVHGHSSLIGGCAAGLGNVASHNGRNGVTVGGAWSIVQGNTVGTDVRGLVAAPNGFDGIHVSAPDVMVGGDEQLAGNLVSGNALNGIFVDKFALRTTLRRNIVGLDRIGLQPVPNEDDGIDILGADSVVGGPQRNVGNVVCANIYEGIYARADRLSILNNLIGVAADGARAQANLNGIKSTGQDTVIRHNVISGNRQYGVLIVGDHTTVDDNVIGLDATGVLPVPNTLDGLSCTGRHSQLTRNVVSGNVLNGMYITGAWTTVHGNFVGVDVSGLRAVGNGNNGIDVRGHGVNITGNVISANLGDGLYWSGTGATLQRNIVGLDAPGQRPLPNADHGVDCRGATATLVANVISSNIGNGLTISGTDVLVVENFIGMDLTGKVAVGNEQNGIIVVLSAMRVIIGGWDGHDTRSNVISGNRYSGVRVVAANVTVQNNFIGTDATGARNFGNGQDGILLEESAVLCLVFGNVVSANLGHGIVVNSADTQLDSNTVGLEASHASALGNGGGGAVVRGGNCSVTHNTVASNRGAGLQILGAGVWCAENVIGGQLRGFGNAGVGVSVFAEHVVVSRNSILGNLKGGVELLSNGVVLVANIIVDNNKAGLYVEGIDAQIESNVITGTSGVGVMLNNNGRAAFLFNNSLFNNTEGSLTRPRAETLPSSVPRAPTLFVTPTIAYRASVVIPVGALSFSLQLFLSDRDVVGANFANNSQGQFFVGEWHYVVAILQNTSGDGDVVQFVDVRGLSISMEYAYDATAIVTFPDLGSSLFSPRVTLTRTNAACQLCLCTATTVNCRSLGLSFLPVDLPSNTTILDMSGNLLRDISTDDWNALFAQPALQFVNLSHSNLGNVDWATLRPVPNMRNLYLSSNDLTALPDFQHTFPRLTTLHIAGVSRLGSLLHRTVFYGLVELVDLSLAQCALSSLPAGVFDSLSALLTLDLSGNPFTALPRAVLSDRLVQLSFLALDRTAMTFDSGDFPTSIDVSGLLNLQAIFWLNNNCAAGFFGVGQSVCLRCPSGTHKGAGADGRPACVACAAGTVDDDYHAQTPCAQCPAGSYSSAGSSGTCGVCAAGSTDADSDPSSACVPCAAGVWVPAGSAGACGIHSCRPGTVDDDNNPSSLCVACPAGTFSGVGVIRECVACAAGTIDHDVDPGTPCVGCQNVTNAFIPVGAVGACNQSRFICAPGFESFSRNGSEPCTASTGAPLVVSALTNSSVLAIGVALGSIVLLSTLWAMVLRVRHHRYKMLANRPYDFATLFAELASVPLTPRTPREIRRKNVETIVRVGEGAFCFVFKGVVVETTGKIRERPVAIKILKKDPTSLEVRDFMREAGIMAQFDHPNIVSIVGACTTGEPFMILLELCDNGALNMFLKRVAKLVIVLPLAERYAMILDVAEGMKYLATLGILHRDLAARNILVCAEAKAGRYPCKISDFGLSRPAQKEDGQFYALASDLVPLRWTAPEALATRRYSGATDVWSFGVVCAEIFDNGDTPYLGLSNDQVLARVKAGKRMDCPRLCPPDVFEAVVAPCFANAPGCRPSFDALCQNWAQIVQLKSSPDRGPGPNLHAAVVGLGKQPQATSVSVGGNTTEAPGDSSPLESPFYSVVHTNRVVTTQWGSAAAMGPRLAERTSSGSLSKVTVAAALATLNEADESAWLDNPVILADAGAFIQANSLCREIEL